MAWNAEGLAELEGRITATLEGRRPLIDVPYYLCIYDPALELRCLREFNDLAARLKAKGYSVEIISLAQWFVEALEHLGFLREDVIRQERQQREQLEANLMSILPDELGDHLCRHLKGKDVSHCAILLRTGALFPFVHVSNLLSRAEGRVRATLVIPFPGEHRGEVLRFLNETDGYYYRAEVLSCWK